MKIDFYMISLDYINFLKEYEKHCRGFTCVPNTQYFSREKFMYGTVLNKDGVDYFVPVSSKIKLQDNNIIIKIGKKRLKAVGTLRFQYMIPVPHFCLRRFNINDIADSSRKFLVREELAFCRRNKSKIERQAEKTYNAITTTKNEKLIQNSCDFKLLHRAYKEYCAEHNP